MDVVFFGLLKNKTILFSNSFDSFDNSSNELFGSGIDIISEIISSFP